MAGGEHSMPEIAEQLRNDLSQALAGGDADNAEALTRQALDSGADPLEVIHACRGLGYIRSEDLKIVLTAEIRHR